MEPADSNVLEPLKLILGRQCVQGDNDVAAQALNWLCGCEAYLFTKGFDASVSFQEMHLTRGGDQDEQYSAYLCMYAVITFICIVTGNVPGEIST